MDVGRILRSQRRNPQSELSLKVLSAVYTTSQREYRSQNLILKYADISIGHKIPTYKEAVIPKD